MRDEQPAAPPGTDDLDDLAAYLRDQPALRAKGEIGLISEILDPAGWVQGPGDDGAALELPDDGSGGPPGRVVACGEALLPQFVAADPYGAGFAAVLTNVNDLAAMGALPLGIVDTIVGSRALAREALRGMRAASELYDVPLVGGHLSPHDGPPALSAFGVGHAGPVLSSTHAAPGQSLVVAACTAGRMRTDFPFFPSFTERGQEMAGDVRVLPALAASGACVAAKDVSMAGLIGSLAMLLEWGRLGATVDLERLPRPEGVPLADWLTCFPAYVFLLCAAPGRDQEVLEAFHARGLSAAVVGVVDDTGLVQVAQGAARATVLDLGLTAVTGLHR